MKSLITLYLSLFFIQTTSIWGVYGEFAVDGRVLELNDSNIDAAISTFDYIFIDFYAPWCGHCKRLNPELDKAAPILAGLKNPVIIAKVNVDKYKSLIKKHDIDGYPTLKIFIHGIPTEYYGPRKFDQLVQYLKKFVAPDVTILNSNSGVAEFVEEAGIDFPVFIGFDVKESMISNLARKYKKKAWFSVAMDFSEDLMSVYDFDKVPALVAIQPMYSEASIFYGPFEENFLEDFIKQNLLPLAVPINEDTLRILKNEGRKIALTIVEDEISDGSKDLIKLLKAAASANRDLIFGYVGLKQFGDFVEAFEVSKKTQLPKMVVWDGDEEYSFVNGSEWIKEGDQGSQITRFLEGYKKGNVIQKRIGPSFTGFIKSLFGLGTLIMIIFIILLMAVFMIFTKDDEPTTLGPRQGAEGTSNLLSQSERGGDKED
ncbi:chaperone [Lithospermum erythrorhizon]|uniref:Chaperone n=1 Tax=Lithospermum erythrorhizon TaxID=34254 RepID=A0AAV3PL01_LITER